MYVYKYHTTNPRRWTGIWDFPDRPHSLNRREWSVQMERFLTGDEKVK